MLVYWWEREPTDWYENHRDPELYKTRQVWIERLTNTFEKWYKVRLQVHSKDCLLFMFDRFCILWNTQQRIYTVFFLFWCIKKLNKNIFSDLSKTECRLERVKALKRLFKGGKVVFIPQCNAVGGYDDIQCYRGVCWCVNKRGTEIPGTRTRGKPDCEIPGKILRHIGNIVQALMCATPVFTIYCKIVLTKQYN